MKTKEYILHALKYFLKLLILVALIYALLFVTGSARVSAKYLVAELFGSWSGWLMIAALALLAAAYPKFGFVKRTVNVDITGDRDKILSAFHASGYSLRDESEGVSMTFRAASFIKRLWMAFDDKITVAAVGNKVIIEGIRKHAVQAEFRINTYLENSRTDEEDE